MQIYLSDHVTHVDVDTLTADLKSEGIEIVTISKHGELVVDDMTSGEDYPYRREVWQMRAPGEGCSNTIWAGRQWEFCRSIKLERSA